jgi:hypothetical protein
LGDPLQSSPRGQTSRLTDAQQAFAKVVGQTLAAAWRRQCRRPADQDVTALPQSTTSTSPTH